MSIFDKKESVLKIELTSYGKKQLANGKFRPVFYSFFDDDVLYDGACAYLTESQSSIEERIFESAHLEPQSQCHGAETKIKETTLNEYDNFLIYGQGALGNSSLLTDYAPAIQVNYLQGTLSGSSNLYTGSVNLLVPQLDSEVVYELTVSHSNEVDDDEFPSDELSSVHFADGTAVDVRDADFVVEILEHNTEFSFENFDVEVYLVETAGSLEILKPLKFLPPLVTLVNQDSRALLDKPRKLSNEVQPTISHVEYYFDVFLDSDVDKSILSSKTSKKARDIYRKPVKPTSGKCE